MLRWNGSHVVVTTNPVVSCLPSQLVRDPSLFWTKNLQPQKIGCIVQSGIKLKNNHAIRFWLIDICTMIVTELIKMSISCQWLLNNQHFDRKNDVVNQFQSFGFRWLGSHQQPKVECYKVSSKREKETSPNPRRSWPWKKNISVILEPWKQIRGTFPSRSRWICWFLVNCERLEGGTFSSEMTWGGCNMAKVRYCRFAPHQPPAFMRKNWHPQNGW